jgi:hypothetical protein
MNKSRVHMTFPLARASHFDHKESFSQRSRERKGKEKKERDREKEIEWKEKFNPRDRTTAVRSGRVNATGTGIPSGKYPVTALAISEQASRLLLRLATCSGPCVARSARRRRPSVERGKRDHGARSASRFDIPVMIPLRLRRVG